MSSYVLGQGFPAMLPTSSVVSIKSAFELSEDRRPPIAKPQLI